MVVTGRLVLHFGNFRVDDTIFFLISVLHARDSCVLLFPLFISPLLSLSVKLAEFQESYCKTAALGCKRHFARDLNPNLPMSWSCCFPVAPSGWDVPKSLLNSLGKGLGKLRVRVLLPSIPVFCINNWVLWMGNACLWVMQCLCGVEEQCNEMKTMSSVPKVLAAVAHT